MQKEENYARLQQGSWSPFAFICPAALQRGKDEELISKLGSLVALNLIKFNSSISWLRFCRIYWKEFSFFERMQERECICLPEILLSVNVLFF